MKNVLVVSKYAEKDGVELKANGLIRVNTNKPEYGSLMLISKSVTITNGFANKRNRVGFITASVGDLEDIVESFGLKQGSDYSESVAPSKIVHIEITESEFDAVDDEGNALYKTKAAHTSPNESGFRVKIRPADEKQGRLEDEEMATADGEAIWWKTEVRASSDVRTDKFVAHVTVPVEDDSVDEFAGAAEAKKAAAKVK